MHDGLGPMDDSDQEDARDPVCGMRVNPAQPKGGSYVHDGHTYYFCNPKCRDKFSASPQTYLSQPPPPPRPAPPAAPPGTIYTCPMDPEVRQAGPGSCPVCGMALEPLTIGAEEEANPELIDMTRRFWVGLVLTLPVFVAGDGRHGARHRSASRTRRRRRRWLQGLLATPVVVWGGWPFFQRGWLSMRTGTPQHVHAHRHRHRRGLRLQPRGDCSYRRCFPPRSTAMAAPSRCTSNPPRSSSRWCCSGRCSNCAPARDRPARFAPCCARAEDRAARARRRRGRRRAARRRACRRPAAGAARREGSRRRPCRRGTQQRRRVDAHRRADAGREGGRRRGHRRDGERHGQFRHAGRAGGSRHRPRADRADGRTRRSAAARRFSGWPTR